MKDELAKRIMEMRARAERADNHDEFELLMAEYRGLRKHWEQKHGRAIICFEVKT